MKRHWRRRIGVLALLLVPVGALAAASGAPLRPAGVSEQRILLLQQDVQAILGGAPDAVVYGGGREAEYLRQIAAATRATAQTQVEILRQQNEIIRLLELLQRPRDPGR
jgi:hypothetical protein